MLCIFSSKSSTFLMLNSLSGICMFFGFFFPVRYEAVTDSELVSCLLVRVLMTAIKDYQTSFVTFELCTPLPCIVLCLHCRLRENTSCSITSCCETYSLIKKDIYRSQTRSTLTQLNSKTNRCKMLLKERRELNLIECSSPQLHVGRVSR